MHSQCLKARHNSNRKYAVELGSHHTYRYEIELSRLEKSLSKSEKNVGRVAFVVDRAGAKRLTIFSLSSLFRVAPLRTIWA